ncbi:MAG: T9SS type A sorting domain-containing protein [Crocinitomicaceae bacterium]|nr:T9SS type A sorting domain-containing protein [Crocinitomicaceae bacterium]
MNSKHYFTTLSFILFFFSSFCQVPTGSSVDPFTSMQHASTVTSAGTYYFSIGGNTFSTQVDAFGYVLVAIDFGNGTGVLPSTTSLTGLTRGILNRSVLKKLDFFNSVKITGPNINYTSQNQMFLSRIRNFKPLSRGWEDYYYNSDWQNNGGALTTAFDSGTCGSTDDSLKLSEQIHHSCSNAAGLHWMPTNGFVKERYNLGNITASQTLNLWVKASCVQPINPGFGINSWNVMAYAYDENNYTTDFNSMSTFSATTSGDYYGYYTDTNLSINTMAKWTAANNPTAVNGWTGCAMKSDYFIAEFKRKGFPSGYYTITLPSQYDEGVKVYVNGVEVASFSSCCINQGVVFTGALCSTSEVTVRLIERTAESKLSLYFQQISWPVDAGANTTAIGNASTSIGTIVNSTNAALLSSTNWTSTPSSSIASTVPVTVTPTTTTTYTLTASANGCTYSDQVTLSVYDYLPVELIHFDVVCEKSGLVNLLWSTASENNADYFAVEKSFNGTEWKEVGIVQASGNSSSTIEYSFIDSENKNVLAYYRLVQVDRDGKEKKYDPLSLECFNEEVLIYPNPTHNGMFEISEGLEYTIFDQLGNQLKKIENNGVYFIRVKGKLYKLINI